MTDRSALPVLVVVDDPENFDAALHFAAREATTRGCGLVLLHAYHVGLTGPENALLDNRSAEKIADETLGLAVEHATNTLGDQVEVSGTLIRGPVVPSIVDVSAESRLVVLQRRDLSRLDRIVTRSTSSGVAAHAHTPVAVVPEGWTPTDGPDVVVTVGVDVPARSHDILRQAMAEARARRATLRVVHTWWSPGYFDDIDMDRTGSSGWAVEVAQELQSVVDELRADFGDVPVSIETQHGRPADSLVEASRTSILVVVGRHDPLVPMGSHLGPVARTVLRAAECPVLLVAPSEKHRGWRRAE